MRSKLSLGFIATLLACEPSGEHGAVARGDSTQQPGTPSGTYALKVCRGTCNAPPPGGLLQQGQLILFDEPLDLTRASRGVQFFLGWDPHPTACWIATTRPARPDVAVWDGVGGSKWQHDTATGELAFQLGETVDTHYEVRGHLHGDTIRGRGSFYSANDGGFLSDDSVVGWRLGPPDRSSCVSAAESAWVRLRAAHDTTATERR